jgi:hypothetical protein
VCDVLQQPILHPAPVEYELSFLAATINQWVQHLQALQGKAVDILKSGLSELSSLLSQYELSEDLDDTAAWNFAKELITTFIFGEQEEVDHTASTDDDLLL